MIYYNTIRKRIARTKIRQQNFLRFLQKTVSLFVNIEKLSWDGKVYHNSSIRKNTGEQSELPTGIFMID